MPQSHSVTLSPTNCKVAEIFYRPLLTFNVDVTSGQNRYRLVAGMLLVRYWLTPRHIRCTDSTHIKVLKGGCFFFPFSLCAQKGQELCIAPL